MMNVEMDKNKKNKHSIESKKRFLPRRSAFRYGGIIRIKREAPRMEQEHHNANHVLHYIAVITYSIIRGIRSRWGADSALRIEAHLTCLKEFIEPNDMELSSAVKSLLRSLHDQMPNAKSEWISFVNRNADSILILSKRYGGLKNNEVQRMKDLYERTQWMRVWWWQVRAERIWIRFVTFIKQVRTWKL